MENPERPLAGSIQEEITDALGAFEDEAAKSRRFLLEQVVPLMNEVASGLQSGSCTIVDLYVKEGANHARLVFGGRVAFGPEPVLPPVLRIAITTDGTLEGSYSTSWQGDNRKQETFEMDLEDAFSARGMLRDVVFKFVSGAEVEYRKRGLISGA